MKALINKIMMLVTAFAVLSCESELNITPPSNIGTDAFYQTADDIEQAVVAAYDALQQEGQYGFNFMIYMEIRSDNASVESPTNEGGQYGDVDLFQVNSGNAGIEDSWNSCYEAIQRCNIVLNRIDAIEMEESVKTIRSGEIRFIRALTYFNMVRLWGDLPAVTTETSDPFDAFDVGRSDASLIYDDIIIPDLIAAIEDLPATNDIGRATLGAAQTLLGKVYLTLEDWDAAASILDQVSGYALNNNFADNFGSVNKNGAESIFEIQFLGGTGSVLLNTLEDNSRDGSPFPNQVAPVGSADSLLNGIGVQRGENIPSTSLYNSFESGDLRRDASIGVFDNLTNFAVKLIEVPMADNDSDINVIVLRYADVLLMRAEALNEVGYVADGDAFDLLNQIRSRAGLTVLSATELPDQASFREAVWMERRHEFVSENHRWFDLIRTGRALEVMNASTAAFSVSDYQLLFPLPLTAIDAINNPEIFPQNTGY